MAEEYFIKDLLVGDPIMDIIFQIQIDEKLYWSNRRLQKNIRLLITDTNLKIIDILYFRDPKFDRRGKIEFVNSTADKGLIFIGGYEGIISEPLKLEKFLIRTDPNLNVLWSKVYEIEHTYEKQKWNVYADEISSSRIIVWLDLNLLIIDNNGIIIHNFKYIDPFVIEKLLVYSGRIFLLGHKRDRRSAKPIFGIMELNDRLELVQFKSYLPNDSNFYPYNGGRSALLIKDHLIIASDDHSDNYIVSFPLTKKFAEKLPSINFKQKGYSIIHRAGTNYFYHFTNNYGGGKQNLIVYKFDFNLNLIWTKKLNKSLTLEYIFTTSNAIFVKPTNRSIGNGSLWNSSSIIKTDSELLQTSCFPCSEIDSSEITKKDLYAEQSSIKFETRKVQTSIINFELLDRTYRGEVKNYRILQLCPKPQINDLFKSTITANPNRLQINNVNTTLVIVQLKDTTGANFTTGGDIVLIKTTLGSLTDTTDKGNGTYEATLSSGEVKGNAQLSFKINNQKAVQNTAVEFYEEVKVDLDKSTIVANPTCINADGTSTSSISVQLKDANGLEIKKEGFDVKIKTNRGKLGVTRYQSATGTYKAVLTANKTISLARLSFTVNNSTATEKAWVRFSGKVPAPETTCKQSIALRIFLAKNRKSSELEGEIEGVYEGENSLSNTPALTPIGIILRTRRYQNYTYILSKSNFFKLNEKGEILWAKARSLSLYEAENIMYLNLYDFDLTDTGDIILIASNFQTIVSSNNHRPVDSPGSDIQEISTAFDVDSENIDSNNNVDKTILPVTGTEVPILAVDKRVNSLNANSFSSSSPIYVLKYGESGNKIWSKTIRNSKSDPIVSHNYINTIGGGNFIIVGHSQLIKIDLEGNVIKAIATPTPIVDTEFSTDFIVIAYEDQQTTNSDISAFDRDLEAIVHYRLPNHIPTKNMSIHLMGDDLIVTTTQGILADGIQNFDTVLFKFSLLRCYANVITRAYYGLRSQTKVSSNLEKSNFKGNENTFFLYGNDPRTSNPILYRLNKDLTIVWGKTIAQSSKNGQPHELSGVFVNKGCISFTMTAIDEATYTDSGWFIQSDLDLTDKIGPCISITETEIPPFSAPSIQIIPAESLLKTLNYSSRSTYMDWDAVTEWDIEPLCPKKPKISYIQSPFLYLQAAGSTGVDGSTKGVHLRWIFKNELGKNHLPKGNLAGNTNHFNKPDDFVKIYKIPYEKLQIVIDFKKSPNYATSSAKKLIFRREEPIWIYEIEGNRYTLYFLNSSQYYNIARSVRPESNPIEFLRRYGNNNLEVETSYSLAFSIEFIVENSNPNSNLQTELIASEEKLLAEKKQGIVARRTFQSNQFAKTYQQAEDIKRVRFKANNCLVSGIKVELYATLVDKADKNKLWQELGQYALTKTTSTAFEYLEPVAALIDGKWPRFNEGDAVNIKNYQHKWDNNKAGVFEKDIKQVVTDYIRLSDNKNNPSGKELISFSDEDSDAKEIAYVDILNIAAADYHVARMLGLGCFDLAPETEVQKFMYAAKYMTKNKIKGYVYEDEGYVVDHIYISLPTSTVDQRLPLPYDIKKIRPGVPTGESFTEQLDNEGNVISVDPTMSLIDTNGYSGSGKSRFVALYAEEDQEEELLLSFYRKKDEFNSSSYTFPVNGGIEVKLSEKTGWTPVKGAWDKPELSITTEYFNKNNTPEIIPLGIPDNGYPLYVHRQTEEGFYTYGTYGINWFSRVSPITKTLEIETVFVPDNDLLPPHHVQALHLVKERPLLLTSAYEQDLLEKNNKSDKTLVRLAFEYNTIQELLSYKITERLELEAVEKLKEELEQNDNVLLHKDAIFKDEKEIFADSFEIFFRNEIPQNIRGKVIKVSDHPSDVRIAVVTTASYKINSSSQKNDEKDSYEYIEPRLPLGISGQNFVGGIFTTNGTTFYIQSITNGTTGVIINVYKKEADDRIQTSVIPRTDVALEAPIVSKDALFMAIENMSDPQSWGAKNPNSKIVIQFGSKKMRAIHREIIIYKDGPDDGEERILEKSRGLWSKAIITPIDQVVAIQEETVDGKVIQKEIKKHKGLYAIAFPFKLPNHPQKKPDAIGNFVNWYGGIVRVHTQSDPTGPRRNLKVLRIENIGSTTKNVVIYASDDSFSTVSQDDDGNLKGKNILTGKDIEVNFYPGYKAYLYSDSAFDLTKSSITPIDETVKYSVFGLRSIDMKAKETYAREYVSPVSSPALMFVHKVIEPMQPEQPKGALYATQPDSFGKATYTVTTSFRHQPYGILYYRSNDRSILGALYTDATVDAIINTLESYDPDIFYANRWDDLLSFEYQKNSNEAESRYESKFDTEYTFTKYPKAADGYRFPKPDKPRFFDAIDRDVVAFNSKYNKSQPLIDRTNFDLNTVVLPALPDPLDNFPPKTVGDYVESAIMNSFVSLTEAPLLYGYIKGENYQPTAKRQVLRDRNGNLLTPGTTNYDIAPMAKRLSVKGKKYDAILFTDFKLDGTSKNTYFYTAREVGSTTQLGPFSTIKGPVKLVNTKEPEAPQIKRVLPILASKEFSYKKLKLEFVDVENIQIGENNKLLKITAPNRASGVASKQILRGNSYVTFKAEASTAAAIGFSSFNTNSEVDSIQFALVLNANGSLHISQSGDVVSNVGFYTTETNFKIEVKGKTIIFSRDEVVLHATDLIKASDFLLDISISSQGASPYAIELFSMAPTYSKEELIGKTIPLTFDIQDNIQIHDKVISKNAGLGTDIWDAGAYSVEYIPSYGSLSFKAKAKRSVIVGLADDKMNQESNEKIDYALMAKSDGHLYVYKNQKSVIKGVRYDENSLLEIERRNNYVLFKKNQRPFYEMLIDNNIPLFVDFSMLEGDSEISNLEMKATRKLEKNVSVTEQNPALLFEVNAYQKAQGIRRLNLYRTMDPENSLSVRTMNLVNSIDLVLTDQLESNILTIKDEFLDLEFVPFSDPLYYRITADREVTHARPKTKDNDLTILVSEYKPSKTSKLLISSIVESSSPTAPDVTYGFDILENNKTIIDNIVLIWKQTVYNGKYHIYNMNAQGNWVKIHEVISNKQEIQLLLGETALDSLLQIEGTTGSSRYYHFKVDAENSVGMMNTKSKIFTIPGNAGITSLEGIGSMIIENTNIVR